MKIKQTSLELKTQRSRINSFITSSLINKDNFFLNKPFLTNSSCSSSSYQDVSVRFLPLKSFNPPFNLFKVLKTAFKYPLQAFFFTGGNLESDFEFINSNSKSIALAKWGVFFSSCFFLTSKKIKIESFLSPFYVYQNFSYLIAFR